MDHKKIKKQLFHISLGLSFILLLFINKCTIITEQVRTIQLFNDHWKFHLGNIDGAYNPEYDDSAWRELDLPHDWSIEGEFNKDNPSGIGGGALPGGIGWYRKTFVIPESEKGRITFVDFDGIYRNSEVWVNGNYLGKRPNGYISFRYDLTPFLKYGSEKNVIAVKVDNSQQPNSRWYSGSGIYRNVWLVGTNKIYIDLWGTFVTTPEVTPQSAQVLIETTLKNTSDKEQNVILKTVVVDGNNNDVSESKSDIFLPANSTYTLRQSLIIDNPNLWAVENPALYKALTTINDGSKILDNYETNFGVRFFEFDSVKGFTLNGEHIKIKGVCNHHDLGCLGAAINTRALERQLEILKGMGSNALRTSHNPPAPELLDLCDKMGFIVMDEAFDMWEKKKTEFDYSLDWSEWHERDLKDMILRDRNHPSVFVWSIGNEVIEQWDKKDSSGIVIAQELNRIVKSLDNTRPVTAACNDISPENPVIKSGALDLIGYNYNHDKFIDFPQTYLGKRLIATETESSLHTRGSYDMPSDSIRRWPKRWDLPLEDGNADNSCSAYDNCSAPWGSTHEETWRIVKKHDFISGMFTWTGFDYLGEPTPYQWPSRSSYFGIIDLAGFPKDAYYLYQSEWTDKPMLHVFPHWNWKAGQLIDVWAYTNCDAVELFLNGKSLGVKNKTGEELHVQWNVNFEKGTLKAVAYKAGNEVLTKTINTAGEATSVSIHPDRKIIKADGQDLSFVTVKIIDADSNMVPYADNLVSFEVSGEGKIIGVDNGLQTSMEPFKANYRKAFNGMCLVVIQSNKNPGNIKLLAKSENLNGSEIIIKTVAE